MAPLNTLAELNTRLNDNPVTLAPLDKYYRGEQPLAFLAPEARTALGNRFGRMSSNIPRLAITSLTERLRVTGFHVDGRPSPELAGYWSWCDLDQLAGIVHREALALARSFVTVWAGPTGLPQVSVESAHNTAVLRDPATREVTAALKRWGAKGRSYAVLSEPDRITRYESLAHTPDPASVSVHGWQATGRLRNPLGEVPVVPFVNSDRLNDTEGRSEMADLLPLTDGLNKALHDLMVASEYFARPRRWASGVELEEVDVLDDDGDPTGETITVNPFPEGNRMMVSEQVEAKFGQLDAANFSSFTSAVSILLGQIMAVSSLPAHYVGALTGTPASADALRAAEASLTARAQARQSTFGRSWEQVGRLMLAVANGTDPRSHDVAVRWADPSTRSMAQEADAVVKLFSAGLLPASVALARLGYTDAEVSAIRAARRAEALDGAGRSLADLLERA